jgi:hypothetical protein
MLNSDSIENDLFDLEFAGLGQEFPGESSRA